MAETTTVTDIKNLINETYPWTKMHFLVTIEQSSAQALFSEVTGLESTVDVIEFRFGNSKSFSPMKVPGLVKHGNLTLKAGYTSSSEFRTWAAQCVYDQRAAQMKRQKILIELLNVNGGIQPGGFTSNSAQQYILEDAWVCKYSAPDMNATQSEIAIETMEIAFERLVIPGAKSTGTGSGSGSGAGTGTGTGA